MFLLVVLTGAWHPPTVNNHEGHERREDHETHIGFRVLRDLRVFVV
jgi:hypothetical protein